MWRLGAGHEWQGNENFFTLPFGPLLLLLVQTKPVGPWGQHSTHPAASLQSPRMYFFFNCGFRCTHTYLPSTPCTDSGVLILTGRLHVILINSMLESVHWSAWTVPTPLKSLSALQHYPLRLGFIKGGNLSGKLHTDPPRGIFCVKETWVLAFAFPPSHLTSLVFILLHLENLKETRLILGSQYILRFLWVGFQWFGEPKGWEKGKGCPPWK